MVNGATPGLLGFSTRANVASEIERFDEMNADVRTRITEVELAAITPDENPDLYNYAIQGGAALFATWCSQCHGSGAAGVQASGYPNLLDDDWLWGGTIDDIHYTIAHGHPETRTISTARYSEMTAFDDILSRRGNRLGRAICPEHLGTGGGCHPSPRRARVSTSDNCAACHMDGRHRRPLSRRAEPDRCDLALWRLA